MSNGKMIGFLVGGVCMGLVAGTVVTMAMVKTPSAQSSSVGAADALSAGNTPIFEVDGKRLTREDLPSEVQDQLFQMQSQMHEATLASLKEVGLRMALAADKKVDTKGGKSLPELRTLLEGKTISEAEMRAFFDANQKSLPPGTTFEQVRPQLEQFMQQQQSGDQVRQEVAKLEEKGRLKVLLKAPVAPFVQLDLTGLPFRGSESAKVVVVEASDYLCPHCRHANEDVEKVLKEYGSKVKFVQANFALRPTGLSGVLVRGAYCANKQGNDQFWKYHEKAFAVPLEAANPISPNTDKAFADTAIKAAQDAGLNAAEFEKCLAAEETKKSVEAANAKLTSVGVTGTPTFFVNNRKIGAPQNLASAVAAELERLSSNPSKAN
ncbi:MAG: thioredoxin domain-containing protein [Silvanigrellaceae bacterium]